MNESHNVSAKNQSKILIIDDDCNILESIKRLFIVSNITVFTAANCIEGLKIIENDTIDIVITDYRMPGIDGMKFLQDVKKKFPGIIRILFSGFIDKELLLRSVNAGWAITFFTKPWDNNIFKNKIIELIEIGKYLNDEELLIKLNSIQYIPALFRHYSDMNEMIKQNKTITDFTEIIKKDPAIAFKIFKAVNTMFYGEKEISSIYQALTLLSYQNLKDIMINMNPVEQLNWQDSDALELKRLFYFSRLMNQYIPKFYEFETGKKAGKLFPDYGILCYIGRIVYLLLYPENYNQILSYLENNPEKTFCESETSLFPNQMTSTQLGEILFKLWNIPDTLYEIIINIDNPNIYKGKNIGIAYLSHNLHNFISYLWSNRESGKIKFSKIKFKNVPKDKLKVIIVTIIDDMRNFK